MTKRWTAYKMKVKDISMDNYNESGFIELGEIKARRVRVMGDVVSKFIADDKKYGFFILDDGTETIRIRAFQDNLNLIEKTKIGELVDVIGRIREYEEEVYVIPEIIKKVNDPNEVIVRKLELLEQNKKVNEKTKENKPNDKESVKVEKIGEEKNVKGKKQQKLEENETHRQKVVKLIKKLDSGEGVKISELNEKYGDKEKVKNVLKELFNEGEIFEPRVGKVKLLE